MSCSYLARVRNHHSGEDRVRKLFFWNPFMWLISWAIRQLPLGPEVTIYGGSGMTGRLLETWQTLLNQKGATVQHHCHIHFTRFITHPLPSALIQPQLLLWKYKQISMFFLFVFFTFVQYDIWNTWCHRKCRRQTMTLIQIFNIGGSVLVHS